MIPGSSLNPTRDLLQSLAAKIYSLPEMHARFLNARLDFSAFGLGLSVENSAPATDIENVLELMLDQIKESGKRLLITIDEVTCSEYIRIFVSSFQIFLRQEQPIFLLMTGLYENLYDLQNDQITHISVPRTKAAAGTSELYRCAQSLYENF